MAEDRGNVHISLPPAVFASVIAAALLGGGGIYGFFGPQMDRAALEACFNNSRIAIDVAAQHGEEFNKLRDLVERNRLLILDRTAYRYNSEQAAQDWAEQRERDRQQDRMIELLDREINK